MERTSGSTARQAGWLFLAAGSVTFVNNYLPGASELDRGLLNALSLVALLVAGATFALPWDRWPARATLLLAPVAFALVAVGNAWGGVSAYSYAIYFVVAFVWVGVSHPPRTSLLLAPLATAAYLAPALLSPPSPIGALSSVTVAIPVCVLVGETVARVTGRLRRALDQTARSQARYAQLVDEALEREAALREAEERFRLAFENAPIGVALVALDAASCGSTGRCARSSATRRTSCSP